MSDERKDEEQRAGGDWAQFGIVMERQPVRFGIPTLPQEYFIEVRAPDNRGERRIEPAGLTFRADRVELGGDGEPERAQFAGTVDGWAIFLEKCYAQIVDFCLPHVDADGNACGRVTYKREKEGRNEHNLAVYESMSPKLADYIEGAMDYVAGRTGDAREAFEAFLSEQPGLRRD